LKAVSSRGLTLDGLKVLDGSRPAQVEQVLAPATVARAATLTPNKVRELVLYGDALVA
jgi:hypothetical protein